MMRFFISAVASVSLSGLMLSAIGCVDDELVALKTKPNAMDGNSVDTGPVDTGPGDTGPGDTGSEESGVLPVEPITPCWMTADDASSIAVEVADDGSPVVANRIDESSSSISWYTPEGALHAEVEVPGVVKMIDVMSDKSVLTGTSLETFRLVGNVWERETSTYTLARITEEGETQWSLDLPGRLDYDEDLFGGSQPGAYRFDAGPDDTITLVGAFGGSIVLGEGDQETTLDAGGEERLAGFIARYTADGVLVFAKSFEAHMIPLGVAVASDGTVYVIGVHPVIFFSSLQVAAFDTDGDLLWFDVSEAPYGADGLFSEVWTTPVHAAVAQDGSFVASGTFYGDISLPDDDGSAAGLSAPIYTIDSGTYRFVQAVFMARYSPQGELLLAENPHDSGEQPWVDERSASGPDTVFHGDRVLVAGALRGEGIFGEGEENEVTLDEEVGKWFLASYDLDGTLDFANYLEAPEIADTIRLAGAADGSLIGVTDADDTAGEGTGDIQTVMEICGY